MVAINFTLLVELLLFLLFLWGSAVFFLRPVLRMLDEREAALEAEGTKADSERDKAGALTGDYRAAMASARAALEIEYREARRGARDAQAARTATEGKKSDEAVAAARAEAENAVARERAACEPLAAGLAEIIGAKLGMEGKPS